MHPTGKEIAFLTYDMLITALIKTVINMTKNISLSSLMSALTMTRMSGSLK